MTKLERIERDISQLSEDELEEFRAWFAAFDAATGDLGHYLPECNKK